MAVALGKAVFIDKDGTLIRDVPYNVDPRLVATYSGRWRSGSPLKKCGI